MNKSVNINDCPIIDEDKDNQDEYNTLRYLNRIINNIIYESREKGKPCYYKFNKSY